MSRRGMTIPQAPAAPFRGQASRLVSLLLCGLLAFASACSDDTSPQTDTGTGDVVDDGDVGADTDDVGPDAAPDVPDEDASDTGTPDSGNEDTGTADTDSGTPDSGADADAGGSDLGTPDTGFPTDEMRIIAVSPERGTTGGGTEILVVGVAFTVDTDIFIGGALCEDIDFVDDTKIICNTPPNDAGVYDVKAGNTLDLASLDDAFTYFAPVSLDGISPDRGPTSGGMPAEVTGAGFTPDTQVSVGGRVALGVEFVDETRMRFLTPPGTSGEARVQVSNENGLAFVDDAFTYYEPVAIERILPGAGIATGGTEVVIEGAGFTRAGELDVYFGLLEADYEVTLRGDLVVTTPPGPANNAVDVRVTSSVNGEDTVIGGFYYFDSAAAEADLGLHMVAPSRGSTLGGDEVVLSGVGLDTATGVRFGSTDVTIVEQTESFLIIETAPSAAGTVNVQVTDGSELVRLRNAFTFVRGVEVTSVEPPTGDVSGGTPFTLSGSGFVAGSVVRFGTLAATDLTVTGSEITGLTPPGVAGPVDVTVTTPEGAVGRLDDGFTYTADLRVLGISPVRGSVSGNTYVLIRGAGFVEPLTVFFGDAEVGAVEILDSATLAVRTPPHEDGFVDVAVTVGSDEDAVTELAPQRFLYFDPLSTTGGGWGEEIVGSVNVTVISDNGAPLPDSYVQLSVRADALYSGVTDTNGQVTLSGPDLSGAQTVTATRLGFSSSTVQAINAENITAILSCVPENQCLSNDDCRDGFVCTCGPPFGPIGICLVDNFCGIEIETQEQYDDICVPEPSEGPPAGIITGNLTGVHKVDDPGPNERIMGMVVTTDPSPFSATPVAPGPGNVLEDDGPYTLRSRLGEIALVALCGVYNDRTEVFTPRYMGVRRGLFIVEDESYEIDIDCDIELTEDITIKAVNPPLAPGGPDNLRHQVFLHFGSEGYFGGFPEIVGTTEELTGEGYPPLTGPLAGLEFFVSGGAYTGTNFPFSIAFVEGISRLDRLVVLPEFTPVPQLEVPRDGGSLVERYFEWSLPTDHQPDFYYLLIYDFNQTTYWDVFVPGDETTVNLPVYPPDAEVGLFPPGLLILQIMAVNSKSFDYDNFDFNDFSIANWRSYAINVFLFNNPG